jgi:hypothetical protein
VKTGKAARGSGSSPAGTTRPAAAAGGGKGKGPAARGLEAIKALLRESQRFEDAELEDLVVSPAGTVTAGGARVLRAQH